MKTDCYAYRIETDDCRCFEVMLCKYKECPLKETRESHKAREEKAKAKNKWLGIEMPSREWMRS